MKINKLILSSFLILFSYSLFAQKQVYIPGFISNLPMDLNDPSSQWCNCRKIETENIVVFWEAGFGSDPSKATGSYKVDMTALLAVAQKSYAFYLDSLKFAMKGSSVTDKYKLMIFLLYTTEWTANGSGQDNLVGTLHVNPAAANINNVLAHEIGHCFEYITGCDAPGGYRYGFGANGAGGNGFWEQCANWMSFKVYPEKQFTEGDFTNYVNNNHKHILHESVRYANYFVQDFWTYKQGKGFLGQLWHDSRKPEDPVETYKRLTSITQEQFNDELYEHAARLTTWDLPAIRANGSNYLNTRKQVSMNLTSDNYWMVDDAVCLENYGYNSIQLHAPSKETMVNVRFKGMAGQSGFRALNIGKGGWRYGFVALLNDGKRVYSDVGVAKVTSNINPEQTLSFTCPGNCSRLWLVVSGAPQEHWKHAWDDNDANDEQWPYQVQFDNTNLIGKFSNAIYDVTLTYDIKMDLSSEYTPTPISLDASSISDAFAMSPDDIAKSLGSTIVYYAINPDGSLNGTSTANAPGHWYNSTGQVTSWGATSFIFSELNLPTLVANVGQYPNRCISGQTYTIKQALVYTKNSTESARVTLIFHVTINSLMGVENSITKRKVMIAPNPSLENFNILLAERSDIEVFDLNGKSCLSFKNVSNIEFGEMLSAGIYLVRVGSEYYKIIKE